MDWKKLIIPEWYELMKHIFDDPRMNGILQAIQKSTGNGKHVYPSRELLFNAFNLVKPDEVTTVIIGQDPYHGPGQAHGLCFSVPEGIPIPPSLRVINEEIERDFLNNDFTTERLERPESGDLTFWADQGVLLLNTALTVEQGAPGSHSLYWTWFTKLVIDMLNSWERPLIFLIWGSHAKQFATAEHHYRLEACHPAAQFRPGPHEFIGCGHFTQVNQLLAGMDKQPIQWNKYLYDKNQQGVTNLSL